MFLVLWDDLTLAVYESHHDVPQAVEALDIEQMREMCDSGGQRYVVEWIRPNQHGRILGLLPWSENGSYRLRPDGSPDHTLPEKIVSRAAGLGYAPGFRTLSDVRAALA